MSQIQPALVQEPLAPLGDVRNSPFAQKGVKTLQSREAKVNMAGLRGSCIKTFNFSLPPGGGEVLSSPLGSDSQRPGKGSEVRDSPQASGATGGRNFCSSPRHPLPLVQSPGQLRGGRPHLSGLLGAPPVPACARRQRGVLTLGWPPDFSVECSEGVHCLLCRAWTGR